MAKFVTDMNGNYMVTCALDHTLTPQLPPAASSFLVMDLLEGGDLLCYISRHGFFEEGDTWRFRARVNRASSATCRSVGRAAGALLICLARINWGGCRSVGRVAGALSQNSTERLC